MMRAFALTAVFSLGSISVLTAHESEKGPNGGQLVDVSGHHVEFTTKGNEIVLYLTESGNTPADSAGAEGKAIVQSDGKVESIQLVPAEPNLLKGALQSPLLAGTKVVVSGKLSDGHSLQARFVVK